MKYKIGQTVYKKEDNNVIPFVIYMIEETIRTSYLLHPETKENIIKQNKEEVYYTDELLNWCKESELFETKQECIDSFKQRLIEDITDNMKKLENRMLEYQKKLQKLITDYESD